MSKNQNPTHPAMTRAQRALEKKLPPPFHRTANGRYSDIFGNGHHAGAFSRRIAADCQSVIYDFDGTDGMPLLDELLGEADRQSRESGMSGVLELTTPAGRVLRFVITPAPAVEVLPPARQ